MRRAIITGCCAGVAALAVTASAAAKPAFTTSHPSAGLRLQYGIDLEDHDADLGFYGLGFAVRGGYTLDFGLYVGANFDYFLGGSGEGPGIEVTTNVWQVQAEVGYDLGLGRALVLRPQLALGLAGLALETCYSGQLGDDVCRDNGETDFAVSPGALAMYDLGPVFVSGEARFNVIMAEESLNALFIGLGAGMTF